MFSLKLVFYYSVRTYFLHSYCFENGLRDLLYKSNLAFGILSYVLSHVWLFASLWTVACWAALSVEFPRQEFWNGLPFPFPGGLPNPGIGPVPPAWQADSLPLSHLGNPLNWIITTVLQRECSYPLNKAKNQLRQIDWLFLRCWHFRLYANNQFSKKEIDQSHLE